MMNRDSLKRSTFSTLFSVVLVMLATASVLRAQDAQVYVSSLAGDRLAAKPDLHFKPSGEVKRPSFTINDLVTYQKMDGFGASLLEAGLMCINTLPPARQEEVLRSLFDPRQGAGFSEIGRAHV